MLTRFQKCLLIAFLAVCLASACFGEWSLATSPHKPNENTTSANHTKNAVKNNSSLFLTIGTLARDNHDALEAVAAIVSAFFAIVLTGSTIALWFVTRKAANAAKSAAEALPKMERAFVFFSGAESADMANRIILTGGIPVAIKIGYGFKNHGRTPAIITSINIGVNYFASGSPTLADFNGDELPRELILGSGDTKENNWHSFEVYPQSFQDFSQGNGTTFFWGKIKYRDVFDIEHETAICAEWDRRESENRFVISKKKEMNYHT